VALADARREASNLLCRYIRSAEVYAVRRRERAVDHLGIDWCVTIVGRVCSARVVLPLVKFV